MTTTTTITRSDARALAVAISRLPHLLGEVAVEKMFGTAVGYCVIAHSRFLGTAVVTTLPEAVALSERNEAARRAGVPGREVAGPRRVAPMPTEAEMRAMVAALAAFGAERR